MIYFLYTVNTDMRFVLRVGLEPTTLRSSGECSSRLSYLSAVFHYTLSVIGGEYTVHGLLR